jgi:LuxR family maltose regulon positive regulatory protein
MRIAPQDMSTMEINGQIAVLWAWLAVYGSEAESIYTHARRALELLNPESRARTAAHCALGVAQMFRGERVEASSAFLKVIDAGQSSGNLMFTVVASIALAGIYASDYKLHLAAATYREVIQMIPDPTHALGFEAHLGLAKILYDWNELDEAESHVLLCCQLAEHVKSEAGFGAQVLRARLMFIRNEHIETDALLTQTNVVAKSRQFTDRMKEAADLQVLLMLRRGEVKKATDLASKHELPIGQARALLAQDMGLEALTVVETHRRSLEAQFLTQEILKVSVLQATILHAIGQMDRALQALRDVVEQAAQQGSIRLFVDEGAPMKMLLRKLQHQTGITTYTSLLLAAFDTQALGENQSNVVTVTTSPHFPLETFSQRELEILRLIQEGHSNQKISEHLFLSLSTVKWHNQNIFAKLDVQRRTEAVARALELKLL